ncbi:hypothetical protein I6F15_00145 [Bradyrhizobium sp. BRP14]|nr:hypothetical protein [Bradyrhizobium sp. BRP14]
MIDQNPVKNRIGDITQDLGEAYARTQQQNFRKEDYSVLAALPDGSGFRLHPVDSGLEAERLSRDDMITAVIELFGLAAFMGN